MHLTGTTRRRSWVDAIYPIAATKGKQVDKLGETIDDLASTASSSSDDDIHSLPPDEEQEAARLEWRAYHLQSGEIDEAEEREEVERRSAPRSSALTTST